MDFVEGFPRVGGKSVILTIVDRFSKMAHFLALSHPYSAQSVARAFFDNIVRLHGFPCSIVSDRDTVFTSHFWEELFKMAGVKLLRSLAFHPQTDGQSEVSNRIIVMYLRCLAGDRPRSWLQWLPWAEFCFNTSYQSALWATPFEVVYGRPPPALMSYTPGAARVAAVDGSFGIVIFSWLKFGNASFLLRTPCGSTRIRNAAMWSFLWATGCCCASSSAQQSALQLLQLQSLVHVTLGHIRFFSELVLSLTACSCHKRRASMMSSTSPC